jgi:uncharacterized protein (DUF952 family)
MTATGAARVYKLMPRTQWEAALADGVYRGSADDRRDGFIHLSAADQVEGTARKHFAHVPDLLILEVDAGVLGPALKWEPSRGGALFPHLYGDLPVEAVLAVSPFEPSRETAP